MKPIRVMALCGSPMQPSRTQVLCASIVRQFGANLPMDVRWVEISTIGRRLGGCLLRSELPKDIEEQLAMVEAADLLIAASPVYNASYTGLFKHFIDFLGMNSLAGKPVFLAATGGSPLHGLMIDQQLRPLLAMKQALTLPMGVYATEADFVDYRIASTSLEERIALAVNIALPAIGRAIG